MTEPADNIFLDKKRISSVILTKETVLISCYAELINDLNSCYVDEERLGSPQYQCDNYDICWSISYEIYSFLRFNKIEQLKNEKIKEIKTEDFAELTSIMELYEHPKKDNMVRFVHLRKIYPLLLRIISLSGYHDDTYMKANIDEAPQFVPEFEK
jgi:hypothetical protein